MKMECDPDSFEADSEGLVLAESINASLPPEVCASLCSLLRCRPLPCSRDKAP